MSAPRSTLSGMTGFARANGVSGAVSWAWETRSVNGKGLDVRLRLPQGWDAAEIAAREAIKARFARGSLSANLSLARAAGASSVRIDEAVLGDYARRAAALVAAGGGVAPATADGLLSLRGVILAEEPEPDEAARAALEADVLAGLERALAALDAARRTEGAALEPVLRGLIDDIERACAEAGASAAARPEAVRDRLARQFDALLPKGLDPERLAVEAAALAVKADVREELDRLAAHIEQALALLSEDKPIGRRFDFLAQEFMREANTLCSKSSDVALTRIGLALKASVDQLREQIQNVE